MADLRSCQQCGSMFEPRREHARFCSVACRVAWTQEHMGDPAVEFSALQWSITGMCEIAERLGVASFPDPPQALALIGETVWWVTIVDATLVRHHEQTYDRVMAGQGPHEQQVIEGTLAGLRFVRNQLAHTGDLAGFAEPGPRSQRVRDWLWQPVPEPSLATAPRRAQAWEMTRYQAYQAHLAGHTIGDTFGQAVTLLRQVSAGAVSATDQSLHATR